MGVKGFRIKFNQIIEDSQQKDKLKEREKIYGHHQVENSVFIYFYILNKLV